MTAFLTKLPSKKAFRGIVKKSLNQIRLGEPSQLEVMVLLSLQPSHSVSKPVPFSARLLSFLQSRTEQELSTEHKRFLNERFWQDLSVKAYAAKYGLANRDQAYRVLDQGIDALADRIREREQQLRADNRVLQNAQIPNATYSQLIAVEALITRTVASLTRQTAPQVVCLSGLGGIGKTSIAHKVTRTIVAQDLYHDVFWLRVDTFIDSTTLKVLLTDAAMRLGGRDWVHQRLETRWRHLQLVLKQRPYLVIIDNVEEDANFEDLLAFIAEFVGPSKVLLTSRVYPTQFAESNYQKISVDELDQAAAFQLIQHYAHESGGDTLTALVKPHQQAIFSKLGGNPFALKLFISMLNAGVAIELALNSLPTWQHKDTYRIYTHIYQRLWDHLLSPAAKQVLQVMTTFADQGGTLTEISDYSQLKDPALGNAISELAQFALLDQRGNKDRQRYGIHRLTNTFLLSEVFKWPSFTKLQEENTAQQELIRSLEHILELWQLRIEQAEATQVDELEQLRAASQLGIVHQELANSVIALIQRSFQQIWHAAQMQKWQMLLEQAVQLSADPASKAELLRQIAYSLREQGQLEKSAEAFGDCWTVLAELPISAVHGACLIGWGETLRRQQNKALAILKLEDAIHIADRIANPELRAAAQVNLGLTLTEINQTAQGLQQLKEALQYFDQIQDIDACITVSINIAGAYYNAGQHAFSRQYYEEVIEYGEREYSAKSSTFLLTFAQAHLYVLSEQEHEAVEMMSNVIQNNSELREYADIYQLFQKFVVDFSPINEDEAR